MTFDKVLSLPFRNGCIVKVLIGGVLQIIPIVSFFSLGYTVECYENGAYNREKMPEWTDWGKKFMNGLCIVAISLIYLLIPILLFGSSLGALFSPRHLGFGVGTGTLILSIVAFIIFSFAIPMAISNFAVKKNFGAAFEFGYIFKLIGSSIGNYIGAYLLYIVAMIACLIISMIPIIGWIFMLFVGFYLGCVAGFLFGSVYGRAINLMPCCGDSVPKLLETPSETAATSEKAFCTNCGNPLSSDDKVCVKCGKQL